MGSTTGRPGQAPARRQQHAASHRSGAPLPVPVPSQAGPVPLQAGPVALESSRPAVPGALTRTAAAACYLLTAFASFVPPALICLLSRRNARFLRVHAVQAVNAALTTLLYGLSSAILAGILALDSLRLGLEVGAAAALLCWLVTFGFLIAAAAAAARGQFCQIPRLVCADLVHPAGS
jgi:uncharacterized Tic20 family protein